MMVKIRYWLAKQVCPPLQIAPSPPLLQVSPERVTVDVDRLLGSGWLATTLRKPHRTSA